ncbi:hypothetical protein HNQ62_001107 [Sulfurisphaera ohwakuensis]|uniref:Uncharacterized protein n=1 Tax=Sulfurisphaera ohwakuensis TaxID=69656 RepID=A0A7J9RS51_SULOH|nr:hypothetical protein [Sulfurisphaera ohwakuensis]
MKILLYLNLSILCYNIPEELKNIEIELFSGFRPYYVERRRIKINISVIEFLSRFYSFCDLIIAISLYLIQYIESRNRKEILIKIFEKYRNYFDIVIDFISFYQ